MTTTRASGAPILTPEQVADLLVTPLLGESVAAQVARVVHTSSSSFRIPVVPTVPAAGWVAEAEEIPYSDAIFSEVTAEFHKLAGLTIISNELAADSSPEAAGVVGTGLAVDMARKLDAAFFGDLPAPAPKGLAGLAGASVVPMSAAITNTDPFVQAIALAENVGATLGAFVANPTDALNLAMVKRSADSNEPLLAVDPTMPTQRVVSGLALRVSSAVPAGTIWGIPEGRAFLVVRQGTTVETDGSPFFTSDRTAVRGKMRVGFAFPHPAAVVKIALG